MLWLLCHVMRVGGCSIGCSWLGLGEVEAVTLDGGVVMVRL